MNTTFSVHFPDNTENAAGIARECFQEIEIIEGKLSRFKSSSDIGLINTLQAGEELYISDITHQCLLKALQMYQQTGGLFDITLGRRIRHYKEEESGPAPEPAGQLIIHPDRPLVTCLESGRELDLGGIGKGFSLDYLCSVLDQWEVPCALLSSGASTHLAYGDYDWDVELTGEQTVLPYQLRQASLSSSGTGIQGCHIVHPDGEAGLRSGRVWVIAETGTASDAWATALLLAPTEELYPWLEQAEEVIACYTEKEGAPHLFYER